MISLTLSVQRGSMASANMRLGRGVRAIPLSIQRLSSSHHLVAASGCGIPSNMANQRRSFFGLSSKQDADLETPGSDKALRHIHIPYLPYPPQGQDPSVWTYAQVDALQEHLRRRLLDHKAAAGSQADEPGPIVVTFTPNPVFTFGLRQHQEVEENTRILSRAVRVAVANNADTGVSNDTVYTFMKPTILTSPRGGLATYHGPGQLVCWPILDLRSKNLKPAAKEHSPLGVRTWAALLEGITSDLFRERYGIEGMTEKENPGVWTQSKKKEKGDSIVTREAAAEPRKIAALGVHLRRYVTSLGIALNLSGPEKPHLPLQLRYQQPQQGLSMWQRKLINTFPWVRIMACGLFDRAVTSVVAENTISHGRLESALAGGKVGSVQEAGEIKAAADDWAGRLASALGLKGGVEQCTPQDVGFTPEPMDEIVAAEYAAALADPKNKPDTSTPEEKAERAAAKQAAISDRSKKLAEKKAARIKAAKAAREKKPAAAKKAPENTEDDTEEVPVEKEQEPVAGSEETLEKKKKEE